MVVGNVLGVVATYVLHPYRPRLSLSRAGEMLGFSKWLVLNNAVQFLRLRSADFIVGRVSGTSALGLFSVAYEISVMPITEIVAPINRVVYSGYAKVASDVALLKRSFSDTLSIIALVALPAGVGISLVATPMVLLFLGAKWADAAPLVAVLAVYGALLSLHSNNGVLYNAIGKPYLLTLTGVCNVSVLLVMSITLILKFGLMGIAAAYLCTSLLLAPFNFYIVCKQISLGTRELTGILWRPVASCGVMAACVKYLDSVVQAGASLNVGEHLVVLTLVGAIAYAVSITLLWLVTGASKSAFEYRLALLLWRKARTTFARS